MNDHPHADLAQPILAAVSAATGIGIPVLLGKTQGHHATMARQTALALIYQSSDLDSITIASIFRRDSGVIYYSLERVRQRLSADADYAEQYGELLAGVTVRRELPAYHRAIPRPVVRRIAPRTRPLAASTHGRADQLTAVALKAKLADAREQVAYWKMKKASSARQDHRLDAGVRLTLWTAEEAALERRLRHLNRPKLARA